MLAQVFQHVPFEGLGSIETWLVERRVNLRRTLFFEEEGLPDPDEIDLLIIMGGPMSANDEPLYPWLAGEKRFIAEAIRRQKAVLGICLGAQLIASALGARVYPNREREIGWLPVRAVPASATGVPLFVFPEEFLAFHWHGETFDIPAGAVRLAESKACPNQAFQYGRRVVGLQFHLETTLQTVRELVEEGKDELISAPHVQSEGEILSAPAGFYEGVNGLMIRLLDFLLTA